MKDTTTVGDVIQWLDAGAPFRYAASWDSCGLQVGDPRSAVSRVLVALDPDSTTLEEAARRDCQCLVTHHPQIFQPLKALRLDEHPAALVAFALRRNIHVVAAHTNLDAAREGTNDQLARLLGLTDCRPLESDQAWRGEDRYAGMGKTGLLERPATIEELVGKLRGALGAIAVRGVGDPGRTVRRVGLCTGSGGGFMEKVVEAGCEAYVTGDVKYHEAQRAREAGLAVVDVGHFASERIVVSPLAAYLQSQARRKGSDVEVLTAREETDPFWTDAP